LPKRVVEVTWGLTHEENGHGDKPTNVLGMLLALPQAMAGVDQHN
jgi:hypothetical protein